jgi:ribosomal protein L5
MKRSRLAKQYNDEMRPALKEQLGLSNIMMVPKLKVVLNVGSKKQSRFESVQER